MTNQVLQRLRNKFLLTLAALRPRIRRGSELIQKNPDMVTILTHPILLLLGGHLLRPIVAVVLAVVPPFVVPVAAIIVASVGAVMIGKKLFSRH